MGQHRASASALIFVACRRVTCRSPDASHILPSGGAVRFYIQSVGENTRGRPSVARAQMQQLQPHAMSANSYKAIIKRLPRSHPQFWIAPEITLRTSLIEKGLLTKASISNPSLRISS